MGGTYRARHPVFAAVYEAAALEADGAPGATGVGVTVTDVLESKEPLKADVLRGERARRAGQIRLNLTASNLANADAVSSSVGGTYRARHPVFAAVYGRRP